MGLCDNTQVKTTRTFLRDCTVASPMALLLFGGALSVQHEAGCVLVDAWLRIRAAAPTAVLVKRLRAALDALLAAKARARPAPSLAPCPDALLRSLQWPACRPLCICCCSVRAMHAFGIMVHADAGRRGSTL